MQAMLACADSGIQLLFLQKSGEIRARWLGQSGQRQRLTQRLIDLLSRADGPALYANWLLSMEKLAMCSFVRRVGITKWFEHTVTDLRKQITNSLGKEGGDHTRLIQSILYGELLIWLSEYGFERNNESLLSMESDLAADLSNLLLWDFYIVLLNSTTPETDEDALQSMARLFQRRYERCYKLFRNIINKLHQFLLEVS